ncbi:hypothetical protein LCGC14_1911940, partial [marine sediment metagenome]
MAKKKKKASSRPSGKSNLMDKLKALKASWKGASPRQSGSPVPDDDYGMEMVSAIISESKSSGRLQVVFTLKVLEGDYEGKEIKKYAGMDTPDNLDYLQGDLQALELEIPDDIDDLGPVLEEAAGLQVDVTVRTNDSFVNLDFNELLTESAEGEEAAEEETNAEEAEEEAEEEPEEAEAEEEIINIETMPEAE